MLIRDLYVPVHAVTSDHLKYHLLFTCSKVGPIENSQRNALSVQTHFILFTRIRGILLLIVFPVLLPLLEKG